MRSRGRGLPGSRRLTVFVTILTAVGLLSAFASLSAARAASRPRTPLGQSLLGGLLGGRSSTFRSSAAPSAVAQVSALQPTSAPELEVTWTPAASGPPATEEVAQLYSMGSGSPTFISQQICSQGCTSMTFRYLGFGTTYEVALYPVNSSGAGPSTSTNELQLVDPCPNQACVVVDATNPIGSANHSGSGFLHALFPVGNEPADLTQLGTAIWRSAPYVQSNGTLNWNSWNVAQADGVPTMLILSDLWGAETGYRTPWSNWSAYAAWVANTVRTAIAQGHRVDYWEVYNEPGEPGYYNNALTWLSVNPNNLLTQFLITYKAIKSADPNAQVVGPSLGAWTDTAQAPNSNYRGFDMVTFLNYAAANNLQLAAVTWHYIGPKPGMGSSVNAVSAKNIGDEVTEARRLIAARPALGNPKIFLNEYGMAGVQSIPGWDVAMLSALSAAGVDGAVRTCWPASLCSGPDLDGLLAPDGVSTNPDYWVHYAYAQMSGSMVATDTNSDSVSAVGSYDPATGTVSALVGRGIGCNQDSMCGNPYPSQLAAAVPATVEFTVPWSSGSVHVTETDIPGQSLNPIGPPSIAWSGDVPVNAVSATAGTVTVTIPAFADGDAYSITFAPG